MASRLGCSGPPLSVLLRPPVGICVILPPCSSCVLVLLIINFASPIHRHRPLSSAPGAAAAAAAAAGAGGAAGGPGTAVATIELKLGLPEQGLHPPCGSHGGGRLTGAAVERLSLPYGTGRSQPLLRRARGHGPGWPSPTSRDSDATRRLLVTQADSEVCHQNECNSGSFHFGSSSRLRR